MESDTPLAANKRAERFVTECLRTSCVWLLAKDGGFANFREDDDTVVPAWSTLEEAQSALQGFDKFSVKEISLREFLELLSQMKTKGHWIGVNVRADLTGVQIPAAVLQGRLSEVPT
jgi:hypothetical protein